MENQVSRVGTYRVRVRWTKGHITQERIEQGKSTLAEKIGNDGADGLAVKGRKEHLLTEKRKHE